MSADSFRRWREHALVLLEQLPRFVACVRFAAWRMRSRLSSIVFWIGPKANFLSTKNAIAKQISIQINQARDDLDQSAGFLLLGDFLLRR